MADKKRISIPIGAATTIILFILGIAFSYGMWRGNIADRLDNYENDIIHINDKFDEIGKEINKMREESINSKLKLVEIDTKLSNIESMIMELKQKFG